jgi:Flp pilus assembly pilin Flp
MNRLLQIWREEDGVLSFEWTLMLTLLTLGIVAGLAGARDAIIDELGDVAEAAQGIDQSYSLAAVLVFDDADNDGIQDPGEATIFTTNASQFEEVPGVDNAYTDCARTDFNPGQAGPLSDEDS